MKAIDVFFIFSLSVPPVAMCFGISTLIGSGLIFGVAVLYGMQVMGKK